MMIRPMTIVGILPDVFLIIPGFQMAKDASIAAGIYPAVWMNRPFDMGKKPLAISPINGDKNQPTTMFQRNVFLPNAAGIPKNPRTPTRPKAPRYDTALTGYFTNRSQSRNAVHGNVEFWMA